MRAALLLLAALSACGDDTPEDEGRWMMLADNYPAALLGVWGTSATDVYVSGAALPDMSPTVLHYDGTAWSLLPTEQTGDLWWVFGVGGSAFFGGSSGMFLRYRNGSFERIPTPGANIIFGIWGSSPEDVWIVGGQSGATNAFVWRYDGTDVTEVGGLPAELVGTGTVWKVCGNASDDVWMGCTSGIVLHWDGANLLSEVVGRPEESLFSISCSPDLIVAAGGNNTNGVIYERVDGQWSEVTPTPDGPVWRGVAVSGDDAYAVGQFASVAHRWNSDPHGLTTEGLHADWIDPDGGLWAVGGKFDRVDPIDGVMIHKGTDDVPMVPAP